MPSYNFPTLAPELENLNAESARHRSGVLFKRGASRLESNKDVTSKRSLCPKIGKHGVQKTNLL